MSLWDMIERVGCCFDWITPLSNEIQGFTNGQQVAGPAEGKALQKMLKAKGIDSRLEYHPVQNIWSVWIKK